MSVSTISALDVSSSLRVPAAEETPFTTSCGSKTIKRTANSIWIAEQKNHKRFNEQYSYHVQTLKREKERDRDRERDEKEI